MALTLNIGKCSLLGNYRENNEDSIDVRQFPDLTVGVVADGMGGPQAGEVASKRAIEIVPRELRKNLSANLNPEAVKGITKRAIVQANEEIMAMGALDKDMKNMGTTVVMPSGERAPNSSLPAWAIAEPTSFARGRFSNSRRTTRWHKPWSKRAPFPRRRPKTTASATYSGSISAVKK